jgi:hypothetical protein
MGSGGWAGRSCIPKDRHVFGMKSNNEIGISNSVHFTFTRNSRRIIMTMKTIWIFSSFCWTTRKNIKKLHEGSNSNGIWDEAQIIKIGKFVSRKGTKL